MKSKKMLLGIGALVIGAVALIAADHIDAPAVTGQTTDITDFYAFEGEDSNNLVFAANVQGLLSPTASADAQFDENVLIEINIDNDGDAVEDLVIQGIPRDGKMFFFGPVAPRSVGLNSNIETEARYNASVDITAYGQKAVITKADGLSYFAGLRDDPFFFDFGQFTDIVAGNASGFNNPGTDTFAGTNVLSMIVEVPKTLLGGNGTLNTWVETKTRQ